MVASILKVFRTKIAHIFVFILVNIFFGAMGVWAPLVQPLAEHNGNALAKLIEVLATGGAYTFAVAYLTASASYIAFEYLDTKDQSYKVPKIITTGVATILVVLCILLTGPQLHSSVDLSSKPELGSREWFQLIILGLSIITGFFLALIQWAGSFSLDAAVDENQANTKEESKKIFGNRRSGN